MREYTVAVKEEWLQYLVVEAESAAEAVKLAANGEGEAGYSEALSNDPIGIVTEEVGIVDCPQCAGDVLPDRHGDWRCRGCNSTWADTGDGPDMEGAA